MNFGDEEEARREFLAQAYPVDQPLPGDGNSEDAMVSLPGGKLGSELRARPADAQAFTDAGPMLSRDEAAASLGASNGRRPLNPDAEQLPDQRTPSPMIDPRNQERPQRKSGGFNLVRGLAGFSGGAAGISAYDKARQDARDEPGRQADQADKLTDRKTRRQELVDAMNPGSDSSKAAQAGFAESARARASMLAPKFPVLAAALEKAADSAAGKNKLQIMDMEKRHAAMFGEATKLLDSDSRQELARQGMDLKRGTLEATKDNAAATRELGQGRLALDTRKAGEDERHHQADEAGKVTAKIEKDQEKLNEKVAGLNEQEELLQLAKEQKKKVNTGWLSNTLQQGLKKIGLESTDFDNLEATIAGVNNQIIKLQAGGNVTAGEAARMRQQLSSLDMDDREFDNKLDAVMRQITVKKKNAAKEYQRKPGGAVRDSAPIGKELVGGQKDSEAVKWAKSNPADPRAKKILEVNGVQ